MAETITREIRRDYLTVQNEPGTQAHNTGLPMTVQNVTDLLENVTRGLDKGRVLAGAGAGNGEDRAEAPSRGSCAAAPGLYARAVFSFGAPLDARLVTTMVKFSHAVKIDFPSFFWS